MKKLEHEPAFVYPNGEGSTVGAETFIDEREKIMKHDIVKARGGLYAVSHYFYSKSHPEICWFWWFIG